MNNPAVIFERIQVLIDSLRINKVANQIDVDCSSELTKQKSIEDTLNELKSLINKLRLSFDFYYKDHAISTFLLGDILDQNFKSFQKNGALVEIIKDSCSPNIVDYDDFADYQPSELSSLDDNYQDDQIISWLTQLMKSKEYQIQTKTFEYRLDFLNFIEKYDKPVEEGYHAFREFSCRTWSYYFWFLIYDPKSEPAFLESRPELLEFRDTKIPSRDTLGAGKSCKTFMIKTWGDGSARLYNMIRSIYSTSKTFFTKTTSKEHFKSLKEASFLLHINGYKEAAALARNVYFKTYYRIDVE